MDMIWMTAIALIPVALLVARAGHGQALRRRAVRVRANTQERTRR